MLPLLPFVSFLCKGTIDMDLITTGVSASERMRRENVLSATCNIIMEKVQLGGPSILLLRGFLDLNVDAFI